MSAIPYKVRRSERAHHPRVVVSDQGVELVVPDRMAVERAAGLIDEKRGWIERTLRHMREAEAALPDVRLGDGGSVPYLDSELRLRVRVDDGRRRSHVARRGDTLDVRLGEPGVGALRSALERWYRRRARVEVACRLDSAVLRTGTTYERLSIRGQRTRWASCSPSGAMSFNWRLLLAPEHILEYVVEHEVAHLELLDHSPRFWRLLGRRCPAYREHERWLRLHGAALHL